MFLNLKKFEWLPNIEYPTASRAKCPTWATNKQSKKAAAKSKGSASNEYIVCYDDDDDVVGGGGGGAGGGGSVVDVIGSGCGNSIIYVRLLNALQLLLVIAVTLL
ncbi:unnamed protein product [Ceratitis capitata]|uniref:(Mediterranean fruit fly) hypothetical protein n=1 Tax=Ceratitis capitata TaxID=7213 RepID=A0A811UM57_CERCA|nr:unnamed protein product [Ceratitis capitata]